MSTTETRYTSVWILKPEGTKIFIGTYNLMHVQAQDRDGNWNLFRGVFAVLAFPITHGDQFISLRHYNEENREEEIGVIVNPREYPAEAQELLNRSLARHYFEYHITRVFSVELKYGLLFFDVETSTAGRRQFEMHWRYDRTQEYGTHGRILLDVRDNRYLIDDMNGLKKEDRERLTRFIYW